MPLIPPLLIPILAVAAIFLIGGIIGAPIGIAIWRRAASTASQDAAKFRAEATSLEATFQAKIDALAARIYPQTPSVVVPPPVSSPVVIAAPVPTAAPAVPVPVVASPAPAVVAAPVVTPPVVSAPIPVAPVAAAIPDADPVAIAAPVVAAPAATA
jgi:hypothetical protein